MTGQISARPPQLNRLAERCRATLNCTGTILAGYCTVCGRVAGAAPAAGPAAAQHPATAATAVAPNPRPGLDSRPTGPDSSPSAPGSAPTGPDSTSNGSRASYGSSP